MLGQFMDKILQWPVVIQGAIGSFLFWICLQLIKYVLGLIQKGSGQISSSYLREKCIREYIYRKYTSQPGLAFYPQGFFVTFDRVLFNIILGLIFLCISFLFLGISSISTSVAIIGSLIYFFKGLIWLMPSGDWEHLGNTYR